MLRNFYLMRYFLIGAAMLGLAGLPTTASASLITRQFEFSSTQGPLIFGPNLGSFAYDDTIAPVGGGAVNAVGLFSDLSVSFGGYSFDEMTANSGWLTFDVSGELLEAHFGNNCQPGGCVIYTGSPQWWIRVGVPPYNINDFAYSGYEGASNDVYQTRENRLLPVPVPPTGVLLGVGLFLMVLQQRLATANSHF